MSYLYLLGPLLVATLSYGAETVAPEDSWSKLQISPQAIASMPYLNFRINIYGDSGKLRASQSRPKYFYAPLSILDPESAVSRRNNVTKEFEMRFRIFLWSEKVDMQIAKYLTKVLRTEVEVDQIQVIPFEKVILASTVQNDNYKVSSDWIPYQFHQDLWFRIICFTLATCDNLAEQMHFNPEQFSHLKLQFSLDSQQSRRRETIIRVESIQSGSLFSELNQRFPKSDEVLLTAADAKRLISESATNVILETFSDEEVVAHQAQSPVYSLLEKLMIAGREAISSDSSERWSSVFWNNDNYRPDKTTKTFNEVYRNSDSEAREKLRDVVSTSDKTSVELGITFKQFSFNSGFTRENSKSNEKEKENFLKTLQQAKDNVQWEGEKFTPKPMVLSRVNMAKIRNSQTLQDLKTQVTYTKAVLSTAINTPSNSNQLQIGGPLEAIRSEVNILRTEVTSLVDKSKTPVYFSVYRTSTFKDHKAILPYDGTWVNEGEAMDVTSGIFTVPYPGIYYFSFNCHSLGSTSRWLSAVLEVNNSGRGGTGHPNSDKHYSTGLSQTLKLKQGDQVWMRFFANELYDGKYVNAYDGPFYGTQFNGMLLRRLD